MLARQRERPADSAPQSIPFLHALLAILQFRFSVEGKKGVCMVLDAGPWSGDRMNCVEI